ncbi:MAG: hypothetical protein ACFHWX_22155 [Bacteroidota bacterium]
MKSSHSRLWKSRRSSLGKKESQLENELESVSSVFEGKAKTVLIGIAVVGVVAIGIGIATRSSGKKKGDYKKDQKKGESQPEVKIVEKSTFSFKNVLLEKITVAILSYLVTQLGHILASNKTEENKKAEN